MKGLKQKIHLFKQSEPWTKVSPHLCKKHLLERLSESHITGSPASSNASVNKARIIRSSSGSLSDASVGTFFKNNCLKSLTASISAISNPPIQLDEQQLVSYFGSQYNLLSVSQREKIVFSIINRSVNLDNPNDVKLQDLLDVSKIKSTKETPKNQQNKNLKLKLDEIIITDSPRDFPKEISPIMSAHVDNFKLENSKEKGEILGKSNNSTLEIM